MKKLNIVILFVVSVLFTGCWDKIELEDRGFVITIGVDKYNEDYKTKNDKQNLKDEGSGKQEAEKTVSDSPSKLTGGKTENRYIVTMALPNVSELAKSSSGDSGNLKSIKKAAGNTISGAMRVIDTYSSQKLYYGHTKVCVLGQDMLKDPELFRETIDALERNKEISRKLIILASKENAEDILNAKTTGEPLLGLFVSDFYKNNINNISTTFRQDLEGVIQQLMSQSNAVIPQVSVENEEIKIGGIAVIKNFELVGWLNDIQTRGYLWINHDKIGGEISSEFNESVVPLRITNKNTKISFKQENNKLICTINLNVDGNIDSYKLNENIFLDTNNYEKIKEDYENLIKEEIQETIDIFQNDLNVDALGFKEILRKNYYNIYENVKDDWNNIFSNMDTNINVNVNIKGSGTIK